MNDENNYDQVRQQLIDMLEELNDRLARITDNVRHTENPIEKDFAEQAIQNENNEVADFLGNAARNEITMIKQAIESIDKGNYGECHSCGEPIKKERLQALPFTTLCFQCANKLGR